MNGEEMEEVNEFKYLGSVMCKHGGTEERQEKGQCKEEVWWGLWDVS